MNTTSAIASLAHPLFLSDGAFHPVFWLLIAVPVALFVAAAFLAPLQSSRAGKKLSLRRRRALIIGSSVFITLGAAACVGFVMANNAYSATYEEVKENRMAFLEDHGLDISEAQLYALSWPKEEPEENAEFGIAQAKLDGKTVTVALAWEDGEVKVYGGNMEELLPLSAE